jgi:hypothetical protein
MADKKATSRKLRAASRKREVESINRETVRLAGK